MPKTSPTDPQTQLERFRTAVDLLGGQRAAARELDVSERQIRFLLAGDRELHDGFLRDTAGALIRHADKCRALERQISPAFAANLTAEQAARQGKPDARRYDAAPKNTDGARETLAEFKAAEEQDCRTLYRQEDRPSVKREMEQSFKARFDRELANG